MSSLVRFFLCHVTATLSSVSEESVSAGVPVSIEMYFDGHISAATFTVRLLLDSLRWEEAWGCAITSPSGGIRGVPLKYHSRLVLLL